MDKGGGAAGVNAAAICFCFVETIRNNSFPQGFFGGRTSAAILL